MKPSTPIMRQSILWKDSFLIAYAELLRRAPQTDKVLPGARLAELACIMADDCVRARRGYSGIACAECKGVGCEACRFTGKAGAADGLHAPAVERKLSLVGPSAPEQDKAAVPSALDLLSQSIATADVDTETKRRHRFGDGGGSADPTS